MSHMCFLVSIHSNKKLLLTCKGLSMLPAGHKYRIIIIVIVLSVSGYGPDMAEACLGEAHD